MIRFLTLLLVGCLISSFSFGSEDLLPPAPPWSGKSRALALPAEHPWATPFEKGGYRVSPDYAETVAWLQKLADASPMLQMFSIGTTLQGRDIHVLVASKEGHTTAAGLKKTGKPTLFSHAGIHAGEIDGKDAGMMLLRDLTVTGKLSHLLDKANFLFIPILNADGHERRSPYNRINQRGPQTMGWRTNGRNLNLNRDFTKLESAELQTLIPWLNAWDPDLYFDIHVTDGIDYQYDITYGFTDTHGHSPNIATWLKSQLTPHLDKKLAEAGHIPGPLIFAMDDADLSKGLRNWFPLPRYSNGYGDARHLPTILVENHSLKPYDQRVFGTYVLLQSALEFLGNTGMSLRQAISKDQNQSEPVPIRYERSSKAQSIPFKGIQQEKVTSPISGATVTRWLGKPVDLTLPYEVLDTPVQHLKRPKGYYVPADWPEIIHKLQLHGIQFMRLDKPREIQVEMIRFADPQLETQPFEGRSRVAAKATTQTRSQVFPAGSVYVPVNQPLGILAMLLLEPESEDSFWQWGYFLEILQRTEYFEVYAVEPLAAQMLQKDPALAKAFQEKCAADPAFAADPRARLAFFYDRSPYADATWLLYPVARALSDP